MRTSTRFLFSFRDAHDFKTVISDHEYENINTNKEDYIRQRIIAAVHRRVQSQASKARLLKSMMICYNKYNCLFCAQSLFIGMFAPSDSTPDDPVLAHPQEFPRGKHRLGGVFPKARSRCAVNAARASAERCPEGAHGLRPRLRLRQPRPPPA